MKKENSISSEAGQDWQLDTSGLSQSVSDRSFCSGSIR